MKQDTEGTANSKLADREESNNEILQYALLCAIKAFEEATSDYNLMIAYDFKVLLFPTYEEGDKARTPMLELSATNRGNFE